MTNNVTMFALGPLKVDSTQRVKFHPLLPGWAAFVTVAPFQFAFSAPKRALVYSLAVAVGTSLASAMEPMDKSS